MSNLVFVYGTLRPSLRAIHDCWPHLPVGEIKGKGRILGKLYQLSSKVPGVKFDNSGLFEVVGEVVAVDDIGLLGFDQLEGHPNTYRRELVDVFMEGGIKLPTFSWCYEFRHIREGYHPLIESGDWTDTYLKAVRRT